MNKEDLENKLSQMRSGASFDYSTRSHDDVGTELINVYDVISQFLKLTQAHTTEELIKILHSTNSHISYCGKCQRGTQNLKLKNSFCKDCTN